MNNMETQNSYNHMAQNTCLSYCTISSMLEKWSTKMPDKEALVFISSTTRESMTFFELYKKSRQFALVLRKLGVRRGDLVAISVSNSPTWAVCEFGIVLAGACACNIAFTYTDGSDVFKTLLKLHSCNVFIIDSGEDSIKWKICRKCVPSFEIQCSSSQEIPKLQHIIAVGTCASETFLKYDYLMAEISDNGDIITPDACPEDAAVGLQTSGSTAIPKVVCHSHFSIVNWGLRYAIMAGDTASDETIYYANRSLSWSGGFPFLTIARGTTHITQLATEEEPRISLDEMVDMLDTECCTWALFVPQEIRSLKQMANHRKLRTVKMLTVGGQPLTRAVVKDGLELAQQIMMIYGSTECGFASNIVVNNANDLVDYMAGFPSEGYEIKVTDENGITVPNNVHGIIWVRATGMFKGYTNDQAATQAVMSPEGWFFTDDVGFMKSDGCIIVSGRKSDVITCGGITVIPLVLESIIRECPGVADVAVVAVPDENRFQEICACIIRSEESQLDSLALESFCSLAMLDKNREFTRVPKHYVFLDKFPLTSSGKLSRSLLKTFAINSTQNHE